MKLNGKAILTVADVTGTHFATSEARSSAGDCEISILHFIFELVTEAVLKLFKE